ncbi:superoxide dismutase [Vibrio cholerae]|nr:superoxide dismutase [Vibrio cholerae]
MQLLCLSLVVVRCQPLRRALAVPSTNTKIANLNGSYI